MLFSSIYDSVEVKKTHINAYTQNMSSPDFEVVRASPRPVTKSESICNESMMMECKLMQSDIKTIKAFISLPPIAKGFLDCTLSFKCKLEVPIVPLLNSAL